MKHQYRLTIIVAIIFALSLGNATAQTVTLNIEQCREMALESNRTLKSASERIGMSKDMLKVSKSYLYPKISLEGTYLYSTSSFTEVIEGGYLPTFVPDASGALVPNISTILPDGTMIFNEYAYMPDMNFEVEIGSIFNGGVVAVQPLYMGGKITNSIKLAKTGVSASELSHKITETEVITEVDKSFYNHIKITELLASAQKYYDVVAEFYRQVESAYKAGMRTRNDVMKVQVSLNEAEILVKKAENGLELSRMNLCYIIGVPITTRNIQLVDNFDMSTQIVDTKLDVTNRPEYELLQKQIDAKQMELKVSRSDFLPSVVALASYGYTNGATINDNPLLDDFGFNIGVKLSVPITHWGEGKNTISAKRREVNIAINQKEDLEQKMILELMQAINSYNEALLQVALTENAVLQAEENMRLSKNNYNLGMETLADYLEAQALWQRAMSNLTEAKSKQRITYTYYQKCTGLVL